MKKLINQPNLIVFLLTLAVLLPQGARAQGKDASDYFYFYTERSADGMPIKTESYSANFYEGKFNFPLLYNGQQLSNISFTSSNESVATIDANGGVVAVGVGTTTITASFPGGDGFNPCSASYTLELTDGRAELTDMGVMFSSSTATATYGDASVTVPRLEQGQLTGESFSYSSSDTGVATVDESSGAVTVVGVGSTTVSAAFEGNDWIKPDSVSYTLTVNAKAVTVSGFTASNKTYDGTTSATLSGGTVTGLVGNDVVTASAMGAFADANVGTGKTVTISGLTLGGTNANNYELDASKSQSSTTADITAKEATLSWSNISFTYDGQEHVPTATVSNLVSGDACTVTVEGAQTNAGDYTATATALSNSNYKLPATVTQGFTISKATPTLTFSASSASAKLKDAFTPPTLTTDPSGLTVSYSSSNMDVATVDANSGVVTLVSVGTTEITASFAGNSNYNEASAKYTLSVGKADAVAVELSFASATVSAVYGDEVVAPELNNPQQLPVTWSSNNERVATVDANSGAIIIIGTGSAVISATFAGNDDYLAKTASFTLTVSKGRAWVAFEKGIVTATLGEDFEPPVLMTNPEGLAVVYSSSNTNVATVDETTGEVTLIGVGTTRITATFPGDNNLESDYHYYDLTVEANLDPIVKEVDYVMDGNDFVNPDGTDKDLSNVIIHDILFTLKDTGSETGDGYDSEDNCIVINTVTKLSALETLLRSGVQPGTAEYAEKFTGLTFLVPAGEGYIIIESQESNGYQLMVKVGTNDPVSIYQTERDFYNIPYSSTKESYVYLWNGGTDVVAASRNRIIHKGKKTMGDVKVHTVSYKLKAASGIETVGYGEGENDERWYDLNGRRIEKPLKKGLYIRNGQKVVVM